MSKKFVYCYLCEDSRLTDEQFQNNDTYTYNCGACNLRRTIIGNSLPIEKRLCNCGGRFIKRKNRTRDNYFYGCSNYPNCTNTFKI
jgi:hypothetical protein